MKLVAITAAIFLDGLAGMSGGLLPNAFIRKNLVIFLAFAAGTLLGVAFLDLMPEALNSSLPPHEVMFAGLAGFFAFYLLQSLLGGHAAGQGAHDEGDGHHHGHLGPMILAGDAAHNITDGVAIAAAFIADWQAGVATTLAVIVHELPQEIGDYAILIAAGYSRARAVFMLLIVQLSAFLGAIVALMATTATTAAIPFLMAFSAGGFTYIAGVDLIPKLRKRPEGPGTTRKVLAFAGGIGAIALLEVFVRV